MHVLILSHNYPYQFESTFGFFCRQQAVALTLQQHSVGVICPLAYSVHRVVIKKKRFLFGPQSFTENNVRTNLFFFPSPPKWKRLRYYFIEKVGIRMINSYIQKHGRPDVIHLHVFHAAAVAGYAKKKYGIPVVWTEHFSDIDNNMLSPYEYKLLQLASQTASVRLAVSEKFCKNLTAKLNRQFEYVPNVYNSQLFKYPNISKPKDAFRFIHIANLDDNKNQIRLLNAFSRAFRNRPDVTLTIIGDGPNNGRLQNHIANEGLANQVKLKGFMESYEVYNELCMSHVFVLSSDYETFGVSIIEAMACGLPAISTRSGGPESIINRREIGILTDKTEESLSTAMIHVYHNYDAYNPELIASIARDTFSYEKIGAALTKIYQACI